SRLQAEPAEDRERVVWPQLPRKAGAGLHVHPRAVRRVALETARELLGVVAVVRTDEQVRGALHGPPALLLELRGESLCVFSQAQLDAHFPFGDAGLDGLFRLFGL